jgi:hypothetical protein
MREEETIGEMLDKIHDEPLPSFHDICFSLYGAVIVIVVYIVVYIL